MSYQSFNTLSLPIQNSLLKKKTEPILHIFKSLLISSTRISKKQFAKFILIGVGTLCTQVTNQHMEKAPIFHKIDQQVFHKISQTKIAKEIIPPIKRIRDLIKEKYELPKYNTSTYTSYQQAFLDVLTKAEGKQPTFYPDNKGVAIAYGWNPTRNSVSFNTEIAKKAGFSTQEIEAIQEISNNHSININNLPPILKKIKLSDQQMKQTAVSLMPYYEEQFLDAMIYQSIVKGRNYQKDLDAYFHLPDQQKAVLTHMAYKVGFVNLLNYKKFYQSFFNYLDNPSQKNLNIVDSHFTYAYKISDGEIRYDTRVSNLHQKIFSETQPHSLNTNTVLNNILAYRATTTTNNNQTKSPKNT